MMQNIIAFQKDKLSNLEPSCIVDVCTMKTMDKKQLSASNGLRHASKDSKGYIYVQPASQ